MNEKIIDKDKLDKALSTVALEDNTEPVRIFVHKNLEAELKYWTEIFNDIAGYKIEGGRPIISKVCALILKELRTKKTREEKRIVIEIRKVIGLKKVKVLTL